jgi:hypothetical protein
MGNALVVPKFAATGEAKPNQPFQRHSNKSPSSEGSSFILAAAFATLSNMERGVSPGNKYPEERVCIPSSDSQSGAIGSFINSFSK